MLVIMWVVVAIVLVIFILVMVRYFKSDKSGIVISDQVSDKETVFDKLENIKKENKMESPFTIAAGLELFVADNTVKKFAYITDTKSKVFAYSDFLRYEIIEDNNDKIVSSAVGKALVGGLLFGGVGAVVGASGARKVTGQCSSLDCIIYCKGLNNPIRLQFVTYPISRASHSYQDIKSKIYTLSAVLENIKQEAEEILNIRRENTNIAQSASYSAPDELEKYYGLWQKGIITEAEFTAKKEQILKNG